MSQVLSSKGCFGFAGFWSSCRRWYCPSERHLHCQSFFASAYGSKTVSAALALSRCSTWERSKVSLFSKVLASFSCCSAFWCLLACTSCSRPRLPSASCVSEATSSSSCLMQSLALICCWQMLLKS